MRRGRSPILLQVVAAFGWGRLFRSISLQQPATLQPELSTVAGSQRIVSRDEPLTATYCSYRLTVVAASVDAVLDALGDRTRRTILERLSAGSLAVGVLADQLPVSRPAVSQHLRVLKDAGLVVESVAGTRRLYRVNKSGLRVVREYFDRFWETALDNFAILAEAEARDDTRKRGTGARPIKKG
jgi:DNA-binding transcriptional ArsR family regulator